MDGESCRVVFSDTTPIHGYAYRVAQKAPDCICENHKVSKNSECKVEDAEEIARCIFHPHHFDDKGNLCEKFIADAHTIGASVSRGNYADNDKIECGCKSIQQLDIERDKRKPRVARGFLVANVGEIRGLRDNQGRRLFGVYDTARPGHLEHADIMSAIIYTEDDEFEQLVADRLLFKLFK